jgi:hypothetical protein
MDMESPDTSGKKIMWQIGYDVIPAINLRRENGLGLLSVPSVTTVRV